MDTGSPYLRRRKRGQELNTGYDSLRYGLSPEKFTLTAASLVFVDERTCTQSNN